mgnify:CR=1 FL=1
MHCEYHTHACQRQYHRRSTGAYERKRDPGDRHEPRHRRHVHQRLDHDHRREPSGHDPTERILASDRYAHACPREEGEQRHDGDGGDEPSLFSDYGEDEVVVGRRQVEVLLPGQAQTHAEQSARSEGVQRLDDLITGVRGIGPRIEERRDPLGTVVGQLDDERPRRDADAEDARKPPPLHSAEPQSDDDRCQDRDRGTEVRLEHHENDHDNDGKAEAPGERAGVELSPLPARDEQCGHQQTPEFGELGRLDEHRPQVERAGGAPLPDTHEDDAEKPGNRHPPDSPRDELGLQQCAQTTRRPRLAQPEVPVGDGAESEDPREDVERLLLGMVGTVRVVHVVGDRGCRVHHHDTDEQKQTDSDHQDEARAREHVRIPTADVHRPTSTRAVTRDLKRLPLSA